MITLLSDFGRQDAYVAVMKGVIAAIAPTQTTCDLTHEIPPQNILSARFNLKLAYPHFPPGAVHLAVVDPGVGSSRRAVAVECSSDHMRCFLVGPDNGILSGVIEDFMAESESGRVTAVALTNSRYWRSGLSGGIPSNTFHGRDIFAPAAAYLASGERIENLGDRLDPHTLTKANLLPFTQLKRSPLSAQANLKNSQVKRKSSVESVQNNSEILGIGCIQHVDRFGNLISNIPEHVAGDMPWQLLMQTPCGPRLFSRIKTYSSMPVGGIAALGGSHGWIEVACNGASAAEALLTSGGVTVGTLVKVLI